MLKRTVCGLLCCATAIFLLFEAAPLCAANAAPAATQKRFLEAGRFKAAEARQGVAVDSEHVYAVDNSAIGKYEKNSGKLVASWKASEVFPALHFDGGVVVEGKLYLPHSNYPESPMTSSVEVFDATTLKPVDTHSFGIMLGSLTWVDRHEGAWWAVFANYSRVFGPSQQPYGNSYWTTLVKFDDDWRVVQGWVFPESLIKRSEPMSISGCSWGPDGRLYVSGHDHPEVYALRFPQMGSVLELEETIPVGIEGQGIAWDRSAPGTLYGINRKSKEVVVFTLETAPK